MQSLASCLANSKSSVDVSHYHRPLSVLVKVGSPTGELVGEKNHNRNVGKTLVMVVGRAECRLTLCVN